MGLLQRVAAFFSGKRSDRHQADGGQVGGAEPTVSARQAMEELRHRHVAADSNAWSKLRSQFSSQVLSARDRERVWRKERRQHPGQCRELKGISDPSTHDLKALEQLVEALGRGR